MTPARPDPRATAVRAVESESVAPTSEVGYGEHYYAEYFGGVSYNDIGHWTRFFADVAENIVRDIAPTTVLDVGCAMGYLVEALRQRGVEAYGIDFSEYAIANARDGARPYCQVGSIFDPYPQRYDLITCIEVVEHLPAADAQRAVDNLCRYSDDVLLTSTPDDYAEETHVNVRPPEYWAALFARNGFFRDVEYEPLYVAPWATRYRRTRDPLPRVVASYERALWHLRREAIERNRLITKQLEELNRERGAIAVSERLQSELSEHQAVLVDMEAQLRTLRTETSRLSASATGRLVVGLQNRALRVAPFDTRRRRLLRGAVRGTAVLIAEGPRGLLTRVGRRMHPPTSPADEAAARKRNLYREWLMRHEPDQIRLHRMLSDGLSWGYRPRVSIIMPVFNPAKDSLEQALSSVVEQIYPNWELCIADDASTEPHVRDVLQRFASVEPRIKILYLPDNAGIADASNAALALAEGEYVAFLDHDDLLRPHALHTMVDCLQSQRDADVLYSDEDKLLASGEFSEPFFKPDWSPDLLLSWNYVTHFALLRRDLVTSLGGFRSGFDGSQDHDLLLRVSEKAGRVSHVAEMLYAWRTSEGSTAVSAGNKPYAREAGRRAVEDALRRRNMTGTVTVGPHPFIYQIRYAIADSPTVAIIIPTRDRVELLRRCIESIEATSTYGNYAITIVDNGSRHPETLDYLKSSEYRVIRVDEPFNYSRLVNIGAAAVDADHVLLLNNDMTVISVDWIEALLEHSQRSDIGAVGARLLFPNGDVQHEGIICGRGRIAGNVHLGWPVVRETSAVTGACLMTRRAVFNDLGGFDESLRVGFNDVDFCFRLRRKGYRVLFTPHAELRHHESASRGPLNPVSDQQRFIARWGEPDEIEDPYLNRHLRWPNPLEFLD